MGVHSSRSDLGELKHPLQNFTMCMLVRMIVGTTVQVQLHLKHTYKKIERVRREELYLYFRGKTAKH